MFRTVRYRNFCTGGLFFSMLGHYFMAPVDYDSTIYPTLIIVSLHNHEASACQVHPSLCPHQLLTLPTCSFCRMSSTRSASHTATCCVSSSSRKMACSAWSSILYCAEMLSRQSLDCGKTALVAHRLQLTFFFICSWTLFLNSPKCLNVLYCHS